MTIKLSETPLRCTWEWQIISVSNAIREKPDWWLNYKNPGIVAKWKDELIQQLPEDKYREAVVDYAINELEYYESLKNSVVSGRFEAGCDVRIFVSSQKVVSDVLKQEFVSQVNQLLEHVPESNKDWHPGSYGRVLDLVHPSLYPLQVGVTPVRQDDGSLKPLATRIDRGALGVRFGTASNSLYQWLPSVFKVSCLTSSVTIESYINNLHPERCRALYQPIADIFASSIPAIEACLTQSISKQLERVNIPDPYDLFTEEFNELHARAWFDERNHDFHEVLWEERAEHFKPIDISWKGLPPPVDDSTVFSLRQYDTLKVIVKLANIHLTPENPTYAGGTWHLEGTQREDIIATVIYYYDIENITESRLSFRASVDGPPYEQIDDHEVRVVDDIGVRVVYGFEEEDLLVKNLGSVVAKEDRIVVFPNSFQHRVEPFELMDSTKPGHRKILCFFITNPSNPDIVATDKVPPQQQNWWAEDLHHAETILNVLPAEVFDMVLDNVEGLMLLEEAKEVREKLMAERSMPEDEDDDGYIHHFFLWDY